MKIPRVYQTRAIVLKAIKLGEADRILTLYTPYLGKLRAVAKGVLRPTSRLAGHVEVLTHSTLLLAHGRNLDIVTQAQTIDSFLPLRQDLWRTTQAFYAAELVDRFTEERLENAAIYSLLLRLLTWLAEGQRETLALRSFEVQLLGALGYRPELYRCLECRETLAPEVNYFSPSAGGTLCPRCFPLGGGARPLSVNGLKVLRLLQEDDLALVRRLKVTEALARELEQLLRSYVTYLLEGEVRSTVFLDILRRQPVLSAERTPHAESSAEGPVLSSLYPEPVEGYSAASGSVVPLDKLEERPGPDLPLERERPE